LRRSGDRLDREDVPDLVDPRFENIAAFVGCVYHAIGLLAESNPEGRGRAQVVHAANQAVGLALHEFHDLSFVSRPRACTWNEERSRRPRESGSPHRLTEGARFSAHRIGGERDFDHLSRRRLTGWSNDHREMRQSAILVVVHEVPALQPRRAPALVHFDPVFRSRVGFHTRRIPPELHDEMGGVAGSDVVPRHERDQDRGT
jgi:hypothetical protein